MFGFNSQAGQDIWIASMLNFKKQGYYIDIGANYGIKNNNTYFFEKLGWDGICIEPNRKCFNNLLGTRKCHLICKALSNKEGMIPFCDKGSDSGRSHIISESNPARCPWHALNGTVDTKDAQKGKKEWDEKMKTEESAIIYNSANIHKIYDVECISPKNVFEKYAVPKLIDYISLDVEGEEFNILKIFPFNEYKVKFWTIEHNKCVDGGYMKNKIYNLMKEHNYFRVVDNLIYNNQIEFEDWYAHEDFLHIVKNNKEDFLKIYNDSKQCHFGSIKNYVTI